MKVHLAMDISYGAFLWDADTVALINPDLEVIEVPDSLVAEYNKLMLEYGLMQTRLRNILLKENL